MSEMRWPPYDVDSDPGDENDYGRHAHTPSDGLCASSWCDDAAAPGHDYCRECLRDILEQENELLGDAA